MLDTLRNFWESTGIAIGFGSLEMVFKYLLMYVIIGVLLYLAIWRKFEPMLLLPIAFGMLLTNLPGAGMYHSEFFFDDFYISFDEAGKAIGLYASDMTSFLSAVVERFGSDAYSLTVDGILKFVLSEFFPKHNKNPFTLYILIVFYVIKANAIGAFR